MLVELLLEKKKGGRCLRGELGRRSLLGIFSSLVGGGFPVIGPHQRYRCQVMDVNGVCTSVSSPSSSSPFLVPSSPPALLQAVRLCHRGPPGVFSGACSPGRQHWTVLACRLACGCICGCCMMPCCWHGYRAAWIRDGCGWLMGLVDGGGGGKKEVTWQHLSHSFHIWDATGRWLHGWDIFCLVTWIVMAV